MIKINSNTGLKATDGMVCVGDSGIVGETVFTTPKYVAIADIKDAERVIRKLNSDNYGGHNDWRLPDDGEKQTLLSVKDQNALRRTLIEAREVFGKRRSLNSIYLSSDDLTRFSDEPSPRNQHVQIEDVDGAKFLVHVNSGVKFIVRPVRSGPMPV